MSAMVGCEQILDSWCNQPANCPHATRGTLHARFDTTGRDHTKAWRCYATDTLTADLRSYSQGSTYCTRDPQLRALLQQCGADHVYTPEAHVSVAVSASGATMRTSPTQENNAASPAYGDVSATGRFGAWLEQCAASAPRCSCLQHGAPEGSVELILRHRAVAFFVIMPDAAQVEA